MQNKKNKAAKSKKDRQLKQKTTGILQLFVVASIGFMAFIVITGLDDVVSKVLTVPALLWAALVLVQRFTK